MPLALALALLALALPPTVAAAFSGRNGPFIVSLNTCDSDRSYLARIPHGGGEITPLTSTCEEGDPPPYIDFRAPDASPLVTATSARIVAAQITPDESGFISMNPDGSDRRLAPLPEDTGFTFAASEYTPSSGPDSERFVFDDHLGSIWQARFDREDLQLVRPAFECGRPRPFDDAMFNAPERSPDGRLIAVRLRVPSTCKPESGVPKAGLWLVRVANGNLVRRIGGKAVQDYDWSPDGKRLVFATRFYSGSSGGNLYVVSRGGKRRRTLVHREGIAESQPAWSPDGRQIAWISLRITACNVDCNIRASLWRVRRSGRGRELVQRLPDPSSTEGFWHAPELTWMSR